MFGIRKTRPPLTTLQRVDIELLMRKTLESVGKGVLLESEVVTSLSMLSLDRSSPERLLESASHEVLQRMRMTESQCEIMIVAGSEIGYPSTYRPAQNDAAATISISEDTLTDPLRTVMELSYQYSNHYWHTTSDPTPLDTDPRTTNLLPICCGLGVLASDACLYDQQWSQGGWTGWSISRSGYYTAIEIGYALALLARARGEVKPKWARALRPDSKVTAQQAWRYFSEHERTGGSLLFDAGKVPATVRDMSDLATWLRGDDRAFALAAGYALAQLDELSPLAIEAAIDATHCGDQDIVPLATRLLGGARPSNRKAETRVRELIGNASPQTSLAAIQSASALGMPVGDFGAKISKLLDVSAADSLALVDVIGQQGKAFGFMGPKICEHIVLAIREIDDDLVDALLECLQRIVDNPQRSLETLIKSPEIRKQALERLTVTS
jgi:hypothetical protein